MIYDKVKVIIELQHIIIIVCMSKYIILYCVDWQIDRGEERKHLYFSCHLARLHERTSRFVVNERVSGGLLTRRLLNTTDAPKHVAIPAASERTNAVGALALFASTAPIFRVGCCCSSRCCCRCCCRCCLLLLPLWSFDCEVLTFILYNTLSSASSCFCCLS